MDNDAGVSVRLTLEPTSKIKAVYDKAFHLSLVVTLAAHQLSTDLHVKNTSTSDAFPPDVLEFQALFHSYILAPSSQVLITPLQKCSYFDKTAATEEEKSTAKVESRAGVDVRQFTDFIYEDPPKKVEVTWPGSGIEVRASSELQNLVVWNPQKEAGSKMGDMEDGGWEKFVCVEPGKVRGFARLEPGKSWTGQQVLTVIHQERRMHQL